MKDNLKSSTETMLKMGVQVKVLQDHLKETENHFVSVKDLHNMRQKMKQDSVGQQSDEDLLLRELESIMEEDPTATVSPIVDDEGNLRVLLIVTSNMKTTFQSFPEVLFIDGTYCVNRLRLPLYSFLVQDGNGCGQSVGYCFVSDERKCTLELALNEFSKVHDLELVQSVIVDKDLNEISSVRSVMPRVSVQICKFHVLQAITREVKKTPVAEEIRQQIIRSCKALVYAKSETAFKEKLTQLTRVAPPAFLAYYHKNWDSCKDFWAAYLTDVHVNLGNTTNNRIEAHNGKIKSLLDRHKTLPEAIRGLMLLHKSKTIAASHELFNQTMKASYRLGDDDAVATTILRSLTPYAAGIVIAELKTARRNTDQVAKENCNCQIQTTTLLPCKHLMALRMQRNEDIFRIEDSAKRWQLAQQPASQTETSTSVEESDDTVYAAARSVPVKSPRKRTMTKVEKFKKAMDLFKNLADLMSLQGMRDFNEKLDSVQQMYNIWSAGDRAYIVPLSEMEVHELFNKEDTVSAIGETDYQEFEEFEMDSDATEALHIPHSIPLQVDSLTCETENEDREGIESEPSYSVGETIQDPEEDKNSSTQTEKHQDPEEDKNSPAAKTEEQDIRHDSEEENTSNAKTKEHEIRQDPEEDETSNYIAEEHDFRKDSKEDETSNSKTEEHDIRQDPKEDITYNTITEEYDIRQDPKEDKTSTAARTEQRDIRQDHEEDKTSTAAKTEQRYIREDCVEDKTSTVAKIKEHDIRQNPEEVKASTAAKTEEHETKQDPEEDETSTAKTEQHDIRQDQEEEDKTSTVAKTEEHETKQDPEEDKTSTAKTEKHDTSIRQDPDEDTTSTAAKTKKHIRQNSKEKKNSTATRTEQHDIIQYPKEDKTVTASKTEQHDIGQDPEEDKTSTAAKTEERETKPDPEEEENSTSKTQNNETKQDLEEDKNSMLRTPARRRPNDVDSSQLEEKRRKLDGNSSGKNVCDDVDLSSNSPVFHTKIGKRSREEEVDSPVVKKKNLMSTIFKNITNLKLPSTPPIRGKSRVKKPTKRSQKENLTTGYSRSKQPKKNQTCAEEIENLRPPSMLNDKQINMANQLLREKYPNIAGLQDPVLGSKLQFDICRQKFVQIIHDGNCHWLTVSNILSEEGSVDVYDSMYETVSPWSKMQITSLLCYIGPEVTVKLRHYQRQRGGLDCGLFAIAAATALCAGKDPSDLRFNQDLMREHFITCIEAEDLTEFPPGNSRIGISRKGNVKRTIRVPVYCHCRLPDNKEERMLECPICTEWFHQSCMGLKTDFFKNASAVDNWKCRNCRNCTI